MVGAIDSSMRGANELTNPIRIQRATLSTWLISHTGPNHFSCEGAMKHQSIWEVENHQGFISWKEICEYRLSVICQMAGMRPNAWTVMDHDRLAMLIQDRVSELLRDRGKPNE